MKDHVGYIFLSIYYILLWFLIHYLIVGPDMLVYIVSIPFIYGASHFYAAKFHSHITLSADSIALPLVIISGVMIGGIEIMTIHSTSIPTIINMLTAFALSWIGGHGIVLVSVYFYEKFRDVP